MYSPSGPQACSAVFVAPFALGVPANPGHAQGEAVDVLDFDFVVKLSTLLLTFSEVVAVDCAPGSNFPLFG
jgi:hypothetical protein